MLTGFAILERELGSIDYARHRLEVRARQRLPAAEAKQVKSELDALTVRRRQVLHRLDDLHQEWDERHPADAGARLRDAPAGRPGGPKRGLDG